MHVAFLSGAWNTACTQWDINTIRNIYSPNQWRYACINMAMQLLFLRLSFRLPHIFTARNPRVSALNLVSTTSDMYYVTRPWLAPLVWLTSCNSPALCWNSRSAGSAWQWAEQGMCTQWQPPGNPITGSQFLRNEETSDLAGHVWVEFRSDDVTKMILQKLWDFFNCSEQLIRKTFNVST